ncbi:hypothetical protein, partial [Streptomyces sp. NPDC060366]|uniref:hypothetical protein n=1 Tax=Streptomyces sp. NPDC060366 TaxID=3347105 RepID=UPI003652B501
KKKARAVAKSTKKATESNADPLYQQARVDCGGYDTCVTERTAKLRTQAADEKQEAAKNKEVEKKKARAVAKSTKKATESNADPLYQQARVDCGGYDTCVTERTAKLRAQKKATAAKTTTGTEQHKQSQKKTQTPDYRGKGGVKASAA